MKHLTDQDLQTLAASDSQKQSAPVKEHLAVCVDCRAQLALYRHLCRALANPPAFTLPANFGKHVSEQVLPPAAVSKDRFEFFVLAAALVAGTAATIYFVGIELLSRLVTAFTDIRAIAIAWNDLSIQLFEYADSERVKIFALALAVLIIMAILDRFILQPLQRKV